MKKTNRKKKKRSRGGKSRPAGEEQSAAASVDASSESAIAEPTVAVTAVDVPNVALQENDAAAAEQQQQQEQQSNEEESAVGDPAEAAVTSDVTTEASDIVPTQAGDASAATASDDAIASSEDVPVIAGFQNQTKKTRAVSAKELSPRQRRRRWLKFQLEPYYKLRRSLLKLSPFQVVMLGRGNRSQILKVELDYDRKAIGRMARESLFPKDHPFSEFLNEAVDEAVAGTFTSRIEQEVFAGAEEHAQQELIEYAVEHLQALLMQRPLRSHRIMMIDAIGTKSAAVVIVDRKVESISLASWPAIVRVQIP